MTNGDMPRPHTRLSSREPTRKRRRAPPPMSVTNVFAESRLPDTAENLWRWPVTSWYLGDVGKADLHITSDRPFVKDAASLPPLEKHYRLRWLEEDASKLVGGEEPQPPEPLPLIPYARQKDTMACARPSRGLGTGVERSAPGRPRKRQCVPKEAPVVEPATIDDGGDNACVAKDALVANSHPTQTLQNARVAPVGTPTATKVDSSATVAKTEPMSVDVKPQPVLQRESKIPPASNFCTPPLSAPSPSASSPSETTACETPLENTSNASPSVQSVLQSEGGTKESTQSDGENIQDDNEKSEDDKSDATSREEVLLQFVSPAEPRLMGTLTYSLPINTAPEEKEKEVPFHDSPPEVKHNTFDEEDVCVEDMDLEFRKSTRPFKDAFDDIDTSDELRPEILRLNTLLNDLGPKTKPLRNMFNAVVQSEIKRQTERIEAEAEEKRIIARLKEIEKEKAVAKAAEKATEKATLAKARAIARRSSGQVGTQGRRRRPPRKIREEPDTDEDMDRVAESDAGGCDLGLVSKPVVIVDNTAPIVENMARDNRKLLLKPEYKVERNEPDTNILNLSEIPPAGSNACKADISVDPNLAENLASRRDKDIRGDVNHESTESKAENKPDVPPEAKSSVKTTVKNEDSADDVAIPALEVKIPGSAQCIVTKALAPATAVVSPDSVKQLGLDHVANERKSELPLLKFVSVPVNSNGNSEEGVRAALAEVTNVQSKSLPNEPVKSELTDFPCTDYQGPASSSAGENTVDMPDGSQKQLTPLEPIAEVTTTPITEIDMDATPESDDESKAKEIPENAEAQQKVEGPNDLGRPCDIDTDSQFVAQSKEDLLSRSVFEKDGHVAEQLDRLTSPVSPLQAVTPTCGFVVVPTTGPTKVLTSGLALVNHMKAMHEEATKNDSLPNGS